ncbi:chemotaxis protein CheY [Skermanella stibiiresistens SB22]|uniref:Chemotaxis protein CheY n=2 Tax=Skermanella TaxID=204447 RepID=W9H711_9PROT|nr:response regulator transcription factor [Skermanella stibiiresistens]EWY39563.1 chemotaxis protein CheY [Skermanella stibiiresistens SB22]
MTLTSRDTSPAASQSGPVVFVVDDDASVREALGALFRSIGLAVRLFGSALEFLQGKPGETPGCIVLDVRLPGVSGLDFQTQLSALGIHLPIIFMTGHGDIPMSVRAMKAGAIDFLAKPFREQDMLDAVAAAIECDGRRRRDLEAISNLRSHFASLTPREQEVLTHVTSGLMNKQIAAALGLSEITVKIHRGNLMRKMGARSLADLVRQAEALGVGTPLEMAR